MKILILIQYSTPPAEMTSHRSEAELEDLYFDDELCNENVCRQRHLRLQSPLTDTLSMSPGGATCCTPTMSAGMTKTTCDCVHQQSDSSGQQSVAEAGMYRCHWIKSKTLHFYIVKHLRRLYIVGVIHVRSFLAITFLTTTPIRLQRGRSWLPEMLP